MWQNKYFLTTYQLHYSPQQLRSNQFQNISTFINNKFPNMIDWTSGNTFTIFQIFPSKIGSKKNPRMHRYILQTTWQLQCESYTSVHWKKSLKTSYIRITGLHDQTSRVYSLKKNDGFWLLIAVLRYNIRKYVLQAIW